MQFLVKQDYSQLNYQNLWTILLRNTGKNIGKPITLVISFPPSILEQLLHQDIFFFCYMQEDYPCQLSQIKYNVLWWTFPNLNDSLTVLLATMISFRKAELVDCVTLIKLRRWTLYACNVDIDTYACIYKKITLHSFSSLAKSLLQNYNIQM